MHIHCELYDFSHSPAGRCHNSETKQFACRVGYGPQGQMDSCFDSPSIMSAPGECH